MQVRICFKKGKLIFKISNKYQNAVILCIHKNASRHHSAQDGQHCISQDLSHLTWQTKVRKPCLWPSPTGLTPGPGKALLSKVASTAVGLHGVSALFLRFPCVCWSVLFYSLRSPVYRHSSSTLVDPLFEISMIDSLTAPVGWGVTPDGVNSVGEGMVMKVISHAQDNSSPPLRVAESQGP